jgi:hypothetical protein
MCLLHEIKWIVSKIIAGETEQEKYGKQFFQLLEGSQPNVKNIILKFPEKTS